MAYALDQFNAIAQDFIDGNVNSGFFQRNVLLNLVTGRAGSDQKNGRPGALGLSGRTAGMKKAEKEYLRGSTFYEPTIQTAKFGGGSGVAYRGSTNTVTNVDVVGALKFPWTMFDQPVKVFKDDLDAASGRFKIVNLISEAVTMATNELDELVANAMWSGNPASQSAKQMTTFIGLRVALDSGANYTTYGNVDKTVETELKPAYYSETATAFSWGLIDQVQKGGTNPNGGAATLGRGANLVLVNSALYYDTIKPLAIADGKDVISAGQMADMGMIGFRNECVKYGNVIITFDPRCPAGDSSAKSQMAVLTMDEWKLQIHPDYDFKWSGWTDKEPINRERALEGSLQLKARFITEKPWLHGYFTQVN